MGKDGGTIAQILGTVLTIVGLTVPGFQWLVPVGIAMSAAGGYFQAQALKKSLSSLDLDFQGNGHLVNSRSISQAIPIIYGTMRVGGNQVYANTSGVDNKFLHVVQTLCEGEIDSVTTVYLDDKDLTDSFYSGVASHEVATGTLSQSVNATLKSAVPAWNDAMIGTAYIYLTLTFDQNKFQNIPPITALVKGKKLFDPRDSSTAYSENPALVIYDLLNNADYGMGFGVSLLDLQSFIDAANFCDTNNLTFNGVLRNQENALDIIEKCLLNFRGHIVYTDGLYKLRIYNFDAPVMSIGQNDVIDGTFNFTLPEFANMPNKLKVKYIDTGENYIVSEFDFAIDTVTSDDGIERINELNLIGTASYQQAVDLATYYYERERLNVSYNAVIVSKGLALEPGDITTMTHDLPAWTDHLIRILDITYNENQTAMITFVEEVATLYDSKLNALSHTVFSGAFRDPSDITTVSGISISEETVYESPSNYETRITYTRILVTITKPSDPFWDHAEAFVSIDGGATYKHWTDTTDKFYIDPAEEELTYFIKIISVNLNGVREDIDTVAATTYQVVGSGLAPPDVTNFTVNTTADTVNLHWTAVTDIDLIGYEIRDGSDWGNAIVVAFNKTVTYALVGLIPGSHTFLIKAKDSRGNYSANAASVSVIVQLPPNYSIQASVASTVGTHSLTAWSEASAVDPSLSGVGQVLHISTALTTGTTGSFLSQEFDVSSALGHTSVIVERYWQEFAIIVTGDETKWNSKFPTTIASTSNQWNKFPTQTWAAIFQSEVSGGISMELLHGVSSGTFTTVENFHIFAHEASARFVKYRVNLTNISSNVRMLMKPTTLVAAYWTT